MNGKQFTYELKKGDSSEYMVDRGWLERSTDCKIPYLLTTIYSLPATVLMVYSSEYMVDGGWLERSTGCNSLSTNYYLLATSILDFRR
ncbi:hypothetical protein J7K43_09120 [Candidatus Calescamantes bacterium]|nr:hypothetical protein [Candidatus Calescamantes bacterium]